MSKNLGVPRINGESFTVSPKGDRWWGIAGLTDAKATVIYGESRSPQSFSAFHKTVSYYRAYIPVENPELAKASKLRIPSSTWKKMNDKFAPQKKHERDLMANILSQRAGDPPTKCFRPPLDSKIVSRFASSHFAQRPLLPSHWGGSSAASGTPIMAMAMGRVSYANPMIVPGNVVVLNHGGGLFSRYMHLSKIKVKEGDVVKAGEIVGLSGATGRVEAPHLHWEVIWKGNHADPFHFLQQWEQLCDQS